MGYKRGRERSASLKDFVVDNDNGGPDDGESDIEWEPADEGTLTSLFFFSSGWN